MENNPEYIEPEPTRDSTDREFALRAKTDQHLAKISALLQESKGYMIFVCAWDPNKRGEELKRVYVRENFPRSEMMDEKYRWEETIEKDHKDTKD